MTAPQSVRRRRRGTPSGIPGFVLQYFRGEGRSILVGAFPYYPLLPDWWREFRVEHPDARPPAPYENHPAFSDQPPPLTEHQQQVLATARDCLKRLQRAAGGN